MGHDQIFVDPFYKVIFEYTLDELMQNVGCKQFVDISTRKAFSERL